MHKFYCEVCKKYTKEKMFAYYSKHQGKWTVKTRQNVFPDSQIMVQTSKGKIFPVSVDKILWIQDGITTFIPKRAIKPRKSK